jgi:predicted nucleic acid-binding protein
VTAFVIDASVAVKWFVPEVHSVAAARWLTPNHDLLGPDLLVAEVGNIVWKKIVRREVTQDEGRRIVRAFDSTPIELCDGRGALELAFEIAMGLNRTVYDSLYVAVAVIRGTALVTADRKLYDVVAASVLGPHVRWVEERP